MSCRARTARQGPGAVQRAAPPVRNCICGLRRWCFTVRRPVPPSPFPSVAQLWLLSKLPQASPTSPIPGQAAALWSPGPNFLLPASSHLWGHHWTDCPANFKNLLPQEAISASPTPTLGSSITHSELPSASPLALHTENHLEHQSIFHLVPG